MCAYFQTREINIVLLLLILHKICTYSTYIPKSICGVSAFNSNLFNQTPFGSTFAADIFIWRNNICPNPQPNIPVCVPSICTLFISLRGLRLDRDFGKRYCIYQNSETHVCIAKVAVEHAI